MVDLSTLLSEMTEWRRDLHQHPEFGFEERRTAGFVAAKLREFGFDDVVEGVGGTGVVGTLKRGMGNRSIALRADMDALRIQEEGTAVYSSTNPGLMHACGHDGHTSMLLGAAKLLADESGFDGTVRFIFQPAEELAHGATAMLADGLMERFPLRRSMGSIMHQAIRSEKFGRGAAPLCQQKTCSRSRCAELEGTPPSLILPTKRWSLPVRSSQIFRQSFLAASILLTCRWCR